LFRVVSDFIDTFFRENARRALAKEPPLTAREAKERWTELMERLSTRSKGGSRRPALTGTAAEAVRTAGAAAAAGSGAAETVASPEAVP
jgi:hypothetical protein